MNQEQAMQRMREQLLKLQTALITLRDELCRMSLSLQDQAVAANPHVQGVAAAETAALFKRLRS